MIFHIVTFSKGSNVILRPPHLGQDTGMGAYSKGIACQQDQDDQQEAHHFVPGSAEGSADDLQPGVIMQQVPQLHSCQQNQEAHEVNYS